MIHFLSLLVLWASVAQAAPILEANDVSILMPLPASPAEMKNHIYLLTGLSKGPEKVFPAGLERELPPVLSSNPFMNETGLYEHMLVTAMRFDPCVDFPKTNLAACKGQLRLVAQIYGFNGAQAVREEGSLHLFYDLTEVQRKSLAEDLFALKLKSPVVTAGKPLYVHPAFTKGGMGSPFGQEVKALILKYANPASLSRVTGTGFVFDTWPFWDTDIKNGGKTAVQKKLSFLTTPDTTQTWNPSTSTPPDLGVIDYPSTVEKGPGFFAVAANYLLGNTPIQSPAVQMNIDSIERIGNPTIHSPSTVDCVSCHVTQMVKANALKRGVSWRSNFSFVAPPSANLQVLTNPEVRTSLANIVQFGYFLRVSPHEGPPGGKPFPSVSERVINDSVFTAKFISEKLLPGAAAIPPR